MPEHTPGPWRAEHEYGGWRVVAVADDRDIAVDLSEADARLIAAAPKLLKAAGSAIWVFNNLHNVQHFPEQFIEFGEAALADCRAAYEQATQP